MIEFHSVPLNDLKPHEPSKDCWCQPELVYDEDDEPIWQHHALDQREKYLSGELKLM